jgi:hypothetical protein
MEIIMSKSTAEIAPVKGTPAKEQKSAKVAPPISSSGKKPDIILDMLCRAKGASIKQLQEATGWQPHSIRAVISGFRKKAVTVSRSQAKDGTTLYHAKKA